MLWTIYEHLVRGAIGLTSVGAIAHRIAPSGVWRSGVARWATEARSVHESWSTAWIARFD